MYIYVKLKSIIIQQVQIFDVKIIWLSINNQKWQLEH